MTLQQLEAEAIYQTALRQEQTDGIVVCAHCDRRPATRWTTPHDPQDPCCEACFEAHFFLCERCEAVTPKSDLQTACVSRQTRWEPAEYEDWCETCAGVCESEPDPDEDRD